MKQSSLDPEIVREEVRRRYGAIAKGEATLTGPEATECCTANSGKPVPTSCCDGSSQAKRLGYSEAHLSTTPDGSNLGLGCGNPVTMASLKTGQTILDLGAGAGFDAFIAAREVGPSGRVIGVDMTPEMVSKARANAKRGSYSNVEFRLGEIEALPVADASVDVIISNCVINLCPDKRAVYREAFRALKPGGRIAVSDVVAREELSDEVKRDLGLHCGCLAGAAQELEVKTILHEVGFVDTSIQAKENSADVITSWEHKRGFENRVYSAEIRALKPVAKCCDDRCCT